MREYGTQLLLVRLYTYSHFGHFCTFILCWQIHDLKKEQRITVLDFSASSIPSVHLYVFRRVTMVIYYKSIYCDNRANWSRFNNKGAKARHVQCSAQYYLEFYWARGSHRVRLKTVFFSNLRQYHGASSRLPLWFISSCKNISRKYTYANNMIL